MNVLAQGSEAARAAGRRLMAVVYPLAIGLCGGAAGVMVGVALCNGMLDARLIAANAAVDDDAMMLVMAWAFGGGAVGLSAGTALGWWIIRPSVFSLKARTPRNMSAMDMRTS